ncbi:mitotic control protein dis3 [Gymnopilus junonius]|uniref:Ribosomal RNA-processing protein 44 n=1 Tax=Gymnopilus junonius TaxID=109634 RepID=A0A9P5TM75_GYMJU|nr:mitotic control protein dis3 [Gymnopilus junonius]
MAEITILKRTRTEAVVTQRKFFKKTARGKVIKVLRERYLRDDVSCGIDHCRECTDAQSLPVSGDLQHPSFPNGHFVLPDTNVFLSQMDLVESPLFTPPIILLQTVLEEVRHRSLPLYNRLKALTRMDEKKIWVFYNEYRAETAIIREEGETPNDRNDRGIRKATAWYNSHLKVNRPPIRGQPAPKLPTIVLMTEDAANRQKAVKESMTSVSVRKYVEGMKGATQLLDLLAAEGTSEIEPTKAVAGRQALYPDYLPTTALLAGVKAGQLHQGHFNANQYNYLEGSVPVPGSSKPVLLVGRENMNRAVDGDIVVVEVFDEKEWKAPADEVVDQDATLKNDDAEDSADEGDTEGHEVLTRESKILQSEKRSAERQPTGRVVGVIKRNWRAYVCHIDSTSLTSSNSTSLSQQTVFATPVSRLLPRIRLRTRQAPSLIGQKILVTIDRWDVTSRYPEGHFVRALGKVESKEAEQESLLLEFDVPYRPFGKAILDCLPKEGEQWVVPPKSDSSPDWKNREDLRELIICSIDPPNCQDIDDALHARPLPNGNIEAGVHIADVSNFVHPDTPMDSEAASRGTTVYLVDKRIDMLPALLGTNLCSLRPFVERLAFSAIWEMTPEAEIVNVRFTKSVIASKAAFTYEEAQIRKDDPHHQDDLARSIRLLNTLAQKLKAKRMAAGALNLASPEVKIQLESPESSDPIDVEQKEMRETNSLVEEFMLLANISVARKIEETFPQTAVLRRHLPPPRTNFEKLQDILLKRKDMKLDVSSSRALAASLDQCIDPSEPAFNTLVRIMATRCMLSAEYFCSGSVGKDTFGHYGLASPIYTHFTSPIRRYADVLAHRQLSAAIGYTPLHASLHSKPYVEHVLDVVNRRHRMAQMAGRASVEFYVGLALKGRGEREKKVGGQAAEVTEDAFVIRTFRNGLGVFVSKLGIEGLVMFKKNMQFDAENYTITVRSTTIAVFDKVTVRISVEKDKNTQRGKVKMNLVHPIDSSGL